MNGARRDRVLSWLFDWTVCAVCVVLFFVAIALDKVFRARRFP